MSIVLNDDVSKIQKGSRTARRISVDDFKKELLTFIRKYNPSGKIDVAAFMASNDPLKEMETWIPIDEDPTVLNDLQRIEFEYDNGAMHRMQNSPHHPDEFMGLHVTETGIPFIGASACGDEEWVEVFFILYFDGVNMRGYVPYYTNTYNPTTDAAFGLNHDDEDEVFLDSIGKTSDDTGDIRCDPKKLLFDIEQTITVI